MPRRPSRQMTKMPAATTIAVPISMMWVGQAPKISRLTVERPDHRGVVERRDQRGVAEAIALGEQHLADAAEDAGGDQEREIDGVGHDPAEGHAGQREQRP